MDDKTVLSLLLNILRAGELYKEFCRRPPTTNQEAYHTAWEFAEAETQDQAKKEVERGHKPKPVQVKKEDALGPSMPRHHYDPVIHVVKAEECLEVRKAPVIPGGNPSRQCRELGNEYLQKAQDKNHQWVRLEAERNDWDKGRRRNDQNRERRPTPDKEHIRMIFGGPEGGDSAVQWKNWVRSIYVG
ncbi:unnamed protein product [Cuscuta campestris]|uniref:Uncharacterized protein n=1 Tax=Cuscuta campestris TaxID=132261 RepID=A0A484MQI3_9ASTE|nr:unnamed protein product [Cuscuta campestris]